MPTDETAAKVAGQPGKEGGDGAGLVGRSILPIAPLATAHDRQTGAPLSARVWRENDRIRQVNGAGYGDMVPDKDIWDHMADHVNSGDADAALFCAAVLVLRATERTTRS